MLYHFRWNLFLWEDIFHFTRRNTLLYGKIDFDISEEEKLYSTGESAPLYQKIFYFMRTKILCCMRWETLLYQKKYFTFEVKNRTDTWLYKQKYFTLSEVRIYLSEHILYLTEQMIYYIRRNTLLKRWNSLLHHKKYFTSSDDLVFFFRRNTFALSDDKLYFTRRNMYCTILYNSLW